jgi:hypothetical protein
MINHPTRCSVALPGIWTRPNNGMIVVTLRGVAFPISCGALANKCLILLLLLLLLLKPPNRH